MNNIHILLPDSQSSLGSFENDHMISHHISHTIEHIIIITNQPIADQAQAAAAVKSSHATHTTVDVYHIL